MPSVSITVPIVAGKTISRIPTLPTIQRPPSPYTPKVYFVCETGEEIRIPFAPQEITIEKIAPVWSTIERPNRQELLVYQREQLPQVTMTLMVAAEDQANNHHASIEQWLTALRTHISQKKRWRFTYGQQVESYWWRFTDASIKTAFRSPVDNSIAVASVDLQLTKASDIAIRTGPVTGGTQPTTPSTGSGSAAYRTHTIKKGDTLWNLAAKYLGDGHRWKEITKLNNITDPRKIRIGQVLKIPNSSTTTSTTTATKTYTPQTLSSYSAITGKPVTLTQAQIDALVAAGLL